MHAHLQTEVVILFHPRLYFLSTFASDKKLWIANLVLFFRVPIVPVVHVGLGDGCCLVRGHPIGSPRSVGTLIAQFGSFRCQTRKASRGPPAPPLGNSRAARVPWCPLGSPSLLDVIPPPLQSACHPLDHQSLRSFFCPLGQPILHSLRKVNSATVVCCAVGVTSSIPSCMRVLLLLSSSC